MSNTAYVICSVVAELTSQGLPVIANAVIQFVILMQTYLPKACCGEVRAILLGFRETFFKLHAIFKLFSSSKAYKRAMWANFAVQDSPSTCSCPLAGGCMIFLFTKLLYMFFILCVKSKSKNNLSCFRRGF